MMKLRIKGLPEPEEKSVTFELRPSTALDGGVEVFASYNGITGSVPIIFGPTGKIYTTNASGDFFERDEFGYIRVEDVQLY